MTADMRAILSSKFCVDAVRNRTHSGSMLPVQLKLPWPVAPLVRPARRHAIEVPGRETPVTIVRHRLARRYVVRVAPDSEVRLTVPRWASIAGGLAFASRQGGGGARGGGGRG